MKGKILKSVKTGVFNIIRGLRYNNIPAEKKFPGNKTVSTKEYVMRLLVFMKLVEENVSKARNDKATELLVKDYIKQKKKQSDKST